jgi:hypothetical protein
VGTAAKGDGKWCFYFEQRSYQQVKTYNQVTPPSREQIDTAKDNLLAVLRERDSHGLCTIDAAGLLRQDDPEIAWRAFYELFSEGLCMLAITSSGLRLGRCGEIHEQEIKRHFGHAYIFRDMTFGLPVA